MESIIIILAIVVIIAFAIIIRLKGDKRDLHNALESWQSSILPTIDASSVNYESESWSISFCELLKDQFDCDGVTILLKENDLKQDVKIVAGVEACRSWSLKSKSDDALTTVKLKEEIPNDFFWSNRPMIYHQNHLGCWVPESIDQIFFQALASPLKTDLGDGFVVLFRERGQFSKAEEELLTYSVKIAELIYKNIAGDSSNSNLEERIQQAKEEGMVHITKGIIHNIGNHIAVTQLALDQLKDSELANIKALNKLLCEELIPNYMENKGEMNEDEFLEALTQISEQIKSLLDLHSNELLDVMAKFQGMTDLINLQQQFVGELGTENILPINGVVKEVALNAKSTTSEHKIALEEELLSKSECLLDPAMMRHILLHLIQDAIESVHSVEEPQITLKTNDLDDSWVEIAVIDNGIGQEISEEDQKSDNLSFFEDKILKYDGTMNVESAYGKGTTVRIKLPRYQPDQSVA